MEHLLQSLLKRRDNLLLAMMLESLHVAIWLDIGSPLSRASILVHFGLFLIWQPVQRVDQRYAWYNSMIFIVLILAFAYWINWWFVFVWLILLIGIVGGRVVTNTRERYMYLLVMFFLVSDFLIGCIPELFSLPIHVSINFSLNYALALLPLVILFFPPSATRNFEVSVDLLHALTASLMVSLLALASLVIMYHTGTDYFTALIQSLLAIAMGLFGISWLLSPHSGFSGLSQLWSRSLLNIGTPFEQWLSELSELTRKHQSADEFLESAIQKLVTLPWLAGVCLKMNDEMVAYGKETKYHIKLTINDQPLILYTEVPISGAFELHCLLLIQLIEYFYNAKVNEHELAKQAHLQAIYETGARITHDIKNLLQSMHSLVSIMQADTESSNSRAIIILKKQFPYFIQRLEQAMNKLQTPQQIERDEIYVKDWWQELQSRFRDLDISFESDIRGDPLIPYDLFDSVTENLLENAIAKRKSEPGIRISSRLYASETDIRLSVCDTGEAIPHDIATALFRGAVRSDNGLGIGLLQAGKQAESLGYILTLENNTSGKVCFELKKGQEKLRSASG